MPTGLRNLLLALFLGLCGVAMAFDQDTGPSRFDPGREAGALRLTGAAADVRGTETDIGPGLSYSGWTYNDVAFLGEYFAGLVGLEVGAERGAYALLSGTNRITGGGLIRGQVGPALRLRLGVFEADATAGYGFAQLPEFNDSAQPSLTRAEAHGALGGLRLQVALPWGVVVEARGQYLYPVKVVLPRSSVSDAKATTYLAGAAVFFPLYTGAGTALRLGLDYQLLKDGLTSASLALNSQLTVNRVGADLELVFGGEIPPPPLGDLAVVALGPKGQPLAQAEIQLDSAQGSAHLTTDANGRAVASGLKMGLWNAQATAPGLLPQTGQIRVHRDEQALLELRLIPPPPTTGDLKVQVISSLGHKPLPGSTVKVRGETYTADASGQVLVKDLKPGAVGASVTRKGFKPGSEAATIVAGQTTELTVTLLREQEVQRATLSGHIRSVAGQPIAAILEIPEAQIRTAADENGSFSLQIDPGRYRVVISAPGFLTQQKSVVLRPGDQAIFNVDLFPVGEKPTGTRHRRRRR